MYVSESGDNLCVAAWAVGDWESLLLGADLPQAFCTECVLIDKNVVGISIRTVHGINVSGLSIVTRSCGQRKRVYRDQPERESFFATSIFSSETAIISSCSLIPLSISANRSILGWKLFFWSSSKSPTAWEIFESFSSNLDLQFVISWSRTASFAWYFFSSELIKSGSIVTWDKACFCFRFSEKLDE